jgi:hypothetical protein
MSKLKNKKVLVFDPLLFKNDIETPLSFTMRPATIVKHYGDKDYDLVDVVFDHRPEKVSRGHFVNMIEEIKE